MHLPILGDFPLYSELSHSGDVKLSPELILGLLSARKVNPSGRAD